MQLTTDVSIARSGELARVAELYASVGYGGGVSAADLTLLAKAGGRLAGVVRLCGEADVTVLRGMQVHPEFQRQGIGRLLLARCVPHLDERTAYCLPYGHLVRFYEQAGFELAEPGELPPFLARRLAGYLASGQQVVAMRRQ
jgi:GNAT superfamily N-acetyltransferase